MFFNDYLKQNFSYKKILELVLSRHYWQRSSLCRLFRLNRAFHCYNTCIPHIIGFYLTLFRYSVCTIFRVKTIDKILVNNDAKTLSGARLTTRSTPCIQFCIHSMPSTTWKRIIQSLHLFDWHQCSHDTGSQINANWIRL